MITFQSFSQRLANGQLKNTSAVDEKNLGIICPEYYGMILSLTNQGLVDLSTRFPLFKSQVDLTFVDSQNIYPLTEVNVGGFLTSTVEEPFTDDEFVKILDVFDAEGVRHTTNTNGHILTPSFNTLRFTDAKIKKFTETASPDPARIRIRYQKKHPVLLSTGSINLPPNLETALQLFVASLYISHMGGPDHSAKGDSYYAAYLRHIGEDESRDLSTTSEIHEDSSKFAERGFV
jgi:hypothetical protein